MPLPATEFDAIVLGLGALGSGAAYWLARRGVRTLGLEQFELGHARGESHDHSRIIRRSYHAPPYVRLAEHAYACWASVESDARERLVYKTGGLDFGPHDAAIPLENYASAMDAAGVPYERLEASEIRRRYPQFRIDDGVRGLFQQDGGIVAAARATAVHQRLAREHGAVLHASTRVESILNRSGEIRVRTSHGAYRAQSLVIAAGPWSAQALAAFDACVPLEITKEQVMYFVPRDPQAFTLGRFPVWIWMDDPSFYGFPIFGEPAVKVAQDAGGKPVDPDTRGFEPDPDITRRVRSFLDQRLPGAAGPDHLIKSCLYTLTPDRDFVIDTLPEHPNVHVAIGAGHAFKFASAIGQILSDLVKSGRTAWDIRPFTIDRPILRMSAPPKRYMV